MAISHNNTPMVSFGINETYQAEEAFKTYLKEYVPEHDGHWNYKTFLNIDTPINLNRFNKDIINKQRSIARDQFTKLTNLLREKNKTVIMHGDFQIDDNNNFSASVGVVTLDGKVKTHTFIVKFVLNTCDLDIALLIENN